ncbi:MAG: hypothetical protein JRI56_00130 [Deltaproteobacteria bacterium]|nr:hypothetical protein [Deltaproteobacteria bacterium]
MVRYRIYTEDVNRDRIVEIVRKYFDSFTLFSATGYWKSGEEDSLVIEIIVEKGAMDVRSICMEINKTNGQECCMVTREKVGAKLI